MAATLLEHPDHGQMHVYNNTDIAYNAKFGWKKVVVKVTEEKAVDLKDQYREKFGKNPNWNQTTKSIEKALADGNST